ncbi:hypothetical protein [Fodinicola feengrottensis]|uniref:hypothetical protein n=1 Tax=Fodinicola feengrottensis TaxID=435914 RepID=UPI0024428121|nr:hypothetical protein [Fodinicola feengrottensis]
MVERAALPVRLAARPVGPAEHHVVPAVDRPARWRATVVVRQRVPPTAVQLPARTAAPRGVHRLVPQGVRSAERPARTDHRRIRQARAARWATAAPRRRHRLVRPGVRPKDHQQRATWAAGRGTESRLAAEGAKRS